MVSRESGIFSYVFALSSTADEGLRREQESTCYLMQVLIPSINHTTIQEYI